VADDAKVRGGAIQAGVNLRMPYSREAMKDADYAVWQMNSGVYYPAPGEPVADRYTPEAAARCIQVVVVSRPEQASGKNILGYYFRWHPDRTMNGQKCRSQEAHLKNQLLAGFAADSAAFVKQKFEHVTPAQFQLAITAKKTHLPAIRQQLVDIKTYNEDTEDWEIEPVTTKVRVHAELMKGYIPIIFKTAPDPTLPFPGVRQDQGRSWWCDQRAC